MAFIKSMLAGVLAGLATAVVWGIVDMRMALHVLSSSSESGGLGVVSIGVSELLIPAAIGFAIGFFLMQRRQRRLARH